VRHISIFDATGESRRQLDVRSNRQLDEAMARVVGLKLEYALKRAGFTVHRLYLYSNDSSLTRLYDFLEIKVSGRASTRSRAACGGSKRQQVIMKQVIMKRFSGCPDESGRCGQARLCSDRFFCKLKRCAARVANYEGVLKLLSGKHVAEFASRAVHHHFRPGSLRASA
jgi:hypothetical protein